MKILHTADWHLGARLLSSERTQEHQAFLDWLIQLIDTEKIDLLLVSGDVFDTSMPKHESTTLYFDFLTKLANLPNVSAIITGGNHDSPAHLNAPKELLSRLHIHVVGSLPANLDQALFPLPEVTICAIPFLREKDLKPFFPAQPLDAASPLAPPALLSQAIGNVYAEARKRADQYGKPIIAMGHLTAAGARLCPDSERDIHIGNLGAVGPEIFQGFAYVALGHLHSYQSVADQPHFRYSGSPIPLSFSEISEAGRKKWVVQVEIAADGQIQQTRHEVPAFRNLLQWKGSAMDLLARLDILHAAPEFLPWIEMILTETHTIAVEHQLHKAAAGRAEIVKLLATQYLDATDTLIESSQSLSDLTTTEVFTQLLLAKKPDPSQAEEREMLINLFLDLLNKRENLQG